MATFREAVVNLKEAILNTKVPESRKEEMFKKVNEMKASMSQEAKDEMKVMMESVMNTTHQLAVEAAAEQVEVMAKMVESNLTESADAREKTSRNVRALMGEEASADGSDLSGRKRAASAVGMAEGSSKVARAKGGSQGGSSSSPTMPNTPSPVVATRSTRHSSAC
jgi:hypothetical protein